MENISTFIERTSKLFEDTTGERVSISKITVSEETAKQTRFSAIFSGQSREFFDFRAGDYVKLIVGYDLMMSNTPMEIRTNMEFINEARGDVFIAGLGLGIILLAICDKPEVKTVTVVEKEKEVIDLVLPFLMKEKSIQEKVKVINADIFTYEDKKTYDVLYFDIWPSICGDNYKDMKLFTKKFRKNRNPNSSLLHWRKDDCRRLARE